MKILAVVDIWVAVRMTELPNSFSGRERTMYGHVKYVPEGIERLKAGFKPEFVVHDASQGPFPEAGVTWVKFSDLTDIVQSFTYDDNIRKEMQELMFTASVDRQAAAISKAQPDWREKLVEDFGEQQRNDTSQRLSGKHFDQMSEAWSAAVRAKVGAPSVHKSPPRQAPVTLSYSEDDE